MIGQRKLMVTDDEPNILKIIYKAIDIIVLLQDSNDNYCPEIITNIDELAEYSNNKIEIIKGLHRDKAIEVLKTRGESI